MTFNLNFSYNIAVSSRRLVPVNWCRDAEIVLSRNRRKSSTRKYAMCALPSVTRPLNVLNVFLHLRIIEPTVYTVSKNREQFSWQFIRLSKRHTRAHIRNSLRKKIDDRFRFRTHEKWWCNTIESIAMRTLCALHVCLYALRVVCIKIEIVSRHVCCTGNVTH